MELNLHAWELLCILYHNSERLKQDMAILEMIIHNIDSLPSNTDQEVIRKARYLNQLQVFLTIYDEPVPNNQSYVSQELTTCLRSFSKLVDLDSLSEGLSHKFLQHQL